MIVEYERERKMIFISKSVNDVWIQIGFTLDEAKQISDVYRKQEQP